MDKFGIPVYTLLYILYHHLIPQKIMTIRFESLGLYLPERMESTADIVSRLKIETPFDLSKIIGIERRHVAADNEDTLSMALDAARDCLQNSRYTAADLDCIIAALSQDV